MILWISREIVPLEGKENHRLGSIHRFAAATRPGRAQKELNSLTNEGLFSIVTDPAGKSGCITGAGELLLNISGLVAVHGSRADHDGVN